MPQTPDAARPAAVPVDRYVAAMRLVASPVGVIAAAHGGLRCGLTSTAICSATTDPPTLLACLNRSAPVAAMIAAAGAFAINFLTEEQSEIARLFSTQGPGGEAPFAAGDWGAAITGAPLLDGAVGAFDCALEHMIPCGAHTLFLGRVVSVSATGGGGLLHRDGFFRRLATE